MRELAAVLSLSIAILSVQSSGVAWAASGCAAGTECLDVTEKGEPAVNLPDHVAQCSGPFPDFIVSPALLANNPEQRWFTLAQDYPTSVSETAFPWKAFDYAEGVDETNAFLYALRDYAYEGMITAGFDPAQNTVRNWYHVPFMNFGPSPREPFHGLTAERPINGPELGIKQGVRVANYAIGFYNEVGAKTIGAVWNSNTPDLTQAHFEDGAMTFKILFSAAKDDDFQNPAASPLLGAPTWTISTASGPVPVRLMQMDVAVADPESPTGWVFGTLAYDRNAPDADPWMKMRPVGLSWGNDEGVTPAMVAAGTLLEESILSDQAPPYAATHLGWAGRINGPIDNPRSGCLSCHGTAQHPANAADILPFGSCNTDAEKLIWFRNFDGSVPFGRVNQQTCVLEPSSAQLVSLDYSLQLASSIESVLGFGDKNPCQGATPFSAGPTSDAPVETTRHVHR
ncbi:MAG: hypothetical protein JWR51_447 [Devosia sp.]|uniref:hypothetical protein n=1 Tax=Devosia sp. TaxID=1871048 RepID=UPI00260945DE|nr:hypothetical protein [Devosia sp.]MDB5527344.1 hypothetical protein [Devosia sp.]